jgi:hypothetical protein
MFASPFYLEGFDPDITLNRINQDNYSGEYLGRVANVEYRMTIRHTTYVDKSRKVTVERHTVEFKRTTFNVDPSIPAVVLKTYTVFEVDLGSDLTAASTDFAQMLFTLTGVNIGKIIGWES